MPDEGRLQETPVERIGEDVVDTLADMGQALAQAAANKIEEKKQEMDEPPSPSPTAPAIPPPVPADKADEITEAYLQKQERGEA